MADLKPIKVLHILKNLQRGGVEQFIFNQYKILYAQNIQFDICLYGPYKTNDSQYMINQFERLGAKIIYLPNPNTDFFSFLKEFFKLLNSQHYDSVHSHQNLFSGLVLPLAKIKKVPVRIAHAHTTRERKKNGFIRKLYSKLMKLSISYSATHLISASSLASQFVFDNNHSAEVLPNGIDLKPFEISASRSIREIIGIPKEDIVLGHIGSFNPIKNHTFIVDLFNELKNRMTRPAHLILVGSGPEQEKIKEKVENLNLSSSVHFLGVREDVADILSSFDLFIFPSLFEGLGISLIESQAAGITAVASSTIPKEVDMELDLISFLPLHDRESWIKEIEKKLSHSETNYSRESRLSMIRKKKFDNKSSAMRLLEIYRNKS